MTFGRFKILFFSIGKTNKSNMAVFLSGRQCKHATNFFSNVHFRTSRAPNIFGSAYVEHKKNSLLFFFAKCFYKSSMPLGGYIPVDGSDIIAILIRTNIIELQS